MDIRKIMEHVSINGTRTINGQVTSTGLSVNLSWEITRLIKDAARCNSYSSDVVYDIESMNRFMENPGNFNNPFLTTEWWFGFRKMGVDGHSFIECRCENSTDVYREYFALYSVEVFHDPDDPIDWWKVKFTEYAV